MRKILILALISLIGCAQNQCHNAIAETSETENQYTQISEESETNRKRVLIVKIRDCEYLETHVLDGYTHFLYTHLGDCQNPIHKDLQTPK